MYQYRTKSLGVRWSARVAPGDDSPIAQRPNGVFLRGLRLPVVILGNVICPPVGNHSESTKNLAAHLFWVENTHFLAQPNGLKAAVHLIAVQIMPGELARDAEIVEHPRAGGKVRLAAQ